MSTPYSIIETLRDFVAKAGQLGLEYMVTGSFAMSAYGEIRMTRDIDVVVELSAEQAAPFAELFETSYYVSDLSVKRAISRKSMFNIINQEFGGKIDCIILKNTDFARQSFRRKRKAKVAGIEFWTTTKEDLIVAKLNWARESRSEVQIRDIANLTSTAYDAEYVAGWVQRLDLIDIWTEVEKWKIRRERTDD